MKLFLFFVPALLWGCTSKITDSNNEHLSGDTLMINKMTYFLDSIGKVEFKSAYEQKYNVDNKEIIDDTTNVKRDTLKLIFHLRNGVDSVLVNDTTEGWSNYIDYSYIESCKNIDYWLLGITYYEGSQYLLLDREKGEKIWIWGIPIYSPNNKYFVCNSCDLEAGYDSNGFQLFEIKNKKAKLRWSKILSDWGPTEIRWKNDSTLYIKQLRMDYKDSKNPEKYSYKSMIIK
jgi:hypothetical protein